MEEWKKESFEMGVWGAGLGDSGACWVRGAEPEGMLQKLGNKRCNRLSRLPGCVRACVLLMQSWKCGKCFKAIKVNLFTASRQRQSERPCAHDIGGVTAAV